MNPQIVKVHDLTWTLQAVEWWRIHRGLFNPEQTLAVLQAAQDSAARDDRAVVSANDLDIAKVKVQG